MNKKLLFLLPLFSLFIMGSTVKKEDITVTVGNVDAPVYNMEVTWDNMEFTYSETVNYIWNKNTHIYELGTSSYKWNTDENKVNIKNNSYMSVNIELNYKGAIKDITGKFNISESSIESGKSITSKLTLDGKLSSSDTSYIKVGLIDLKIS